LPDVKKLKQILRFFPNGHGSVYTFTSDGQYVGPFRYEPGANKFTFINNGETYSFTVNGNVLLWEGVTVEFRKR